MKLKDIVVQNQVETDEFGRANGVLIVDKPTDVTSHDIVDLVRREYMTRKVGHAGALDPFATGLLILLVGKSTKMSNEMIGWDKEYEADVLFGVATDTGDVEGRVANNKENLPAQAGRTNDKYEENQSSSVGLKRSQDDLKQTLQSFTPSYEQYVPVFSSVKVDGDKLRVLARRYKSFNIIEKKGRKIVQFFDSNEIKKEIELPKKEVKIHEIDLLGLKELSSEDIVDSFHINNKDLKDTLIKSKSWKVAKIRVSCSKGTYVRQLAVDIGEKLNLPSMLVGLRRTKVGEYGITDGRNVINHVPTTE